MRPHLKIGLCIVIALLMVGTASAWADQYRQEITLTGGASGAQADYQIMLNVTYNAHMQADFDDLRFTDTSDTQISAWMESKVDSSYAMVCVEFPTTPANGADAHYYMYYGNSSVSDEWDINGTFLFGDDFVNDNKWTISDTAAINVEDGVMRVKAVTGGKNAYVTNKPTLADNFVMEYDYKPTVGYTSAGASGIGLAQTTGYAGGDNIILCWHYGGVGTATINARSAASGVPYIGTQISPYIVNETYKFQFVKLGASVTTKIWDTSHSESSPNVSDVLTCRDSYEYAYIDIFTRPGYIQPAADIDNIRFRKHVANPATYAFGSEYTQPPPTTPVIVASNNITGTQSHIPLAYGTAVLFNATAEGSTTWSWALDGVDQSNPHDNYTHTFTDGFGYYAVTVTATNETLTDSYTWGIWENIETTAETIPTFTDTSYQMLLDSIDYPPDMEDFGKAMAHPFVQMVGVIFYLFIFGIPLLMMYIRQDNMTLPTTLLLLFGSIIIFMLPPQWQIIAGALMTLGFVGILFKLYKERER